MTKRVPSSEELAAGGRNKRLRHSARATRAFKGRPKPKTAATF